MPVDLLVENDQLVADLRDALRDGRSGLNYVPKLLRVVLERDAWRKRIDSATHAEVGFGSFIEFVTAAPTEGLGASVDLIDRIVGTGDPELLRLVRDAKRGTRGRPRLGVKRSDSEPINSETAAYASERLARDAPEEYEAVRRGEKTINAAARAAGIRPHRISVRLDRPQSIADSLRRHMSPADVAELARLLGEG